MTVVTKEPDGYEITQDLAHNLARLAELQVELKQVVEERMRAEIALLQAKTKERTIRDEAKMLTSEMMTRQSLLRAIPR